MTRNAIVICNLGGPSSLDELRPFLFNLFYDKRILPLSKPLRYVLAKAISSLRYKKSASCYEKIGGKSPILAETTKQLYAIQEKLDLDQTKCIQKVFLAMRYSSPRLSDIIDDIKKFAPSKITLLPMYPHFSFATTLSFFDEWNEISMQYLHGIKQEFVCCYFDEPGFIEAHSELIISEYNKAIKIGNPRVIFSAHSIPTSLVDKGDPYEEQIRASVGLIVSFMGIQNLDYSISYQSKIGPVKWLQPSTSEEISRAVSDKVPVVIVPISFVSENLESLFDLDILYKNMFPDANMFFRVPALGTSEKFILSIVNIINSGCKKRCNQKGKQCFYKIFDKTAT